MQIENARTTPMPQAASASAAAKIGQSPGDDLPVVGRRTAETIGDLTAYGLGTDGLPVGSEVRHAQFRYG